ncbi:hypothetical protein KL938_002192 [Ogataea parapolymorpha]|nr:hypothetical protein KL938_002192 [Ogataea parapolymorpha]
MDIEVLETREEAQLEPKKQVSVEDEDVELESVGSLLDDDTEKPNAADVATRGQELVDERTEYTEDGESELEYESDHVELEEEEKEELEQEPETQPIEEPELGVKEEEDNDEEEEDEEGDEEVGLTDEELAGEEGHEEPEQVGTIEENQDAPEEDPSEVVREPNGLSYEVPIYIDLGTEVYKLVQPSVPEEADFKDLTVLFGEDIFELSLELFFSRLKAKHRFKEERELILKCSSLGDLTIEEDNIHCSNVSVGDIVDLFKGLRSQSDNPDLYKFIQFEVVTRPRFIMQYERLKSQLESGKGLESVEWESSTDSLPRKKIKTDVT